MWLNATDELDSFCTFDEGTDDVSVVTRVVIVPVVDADVCTGKRVISTLVCAVLSKVSVGVGNNVTVTVVVDTVLLLENKLCKNFSLTETLLLPVVTLALIILLTKDGKTTVV